MFRAMAYLAILVLFAEWPISVWADPVYVDANATGNNDGSSWADAYTDLSVAVSATQPPAEIWVASATYSGPVSLRNQVQIYGGFEGIETSVSESDPDANPTYVTGGGTVQAVISIDNDATAVVRGFYVTGGYVSYSNQNLYGAGLFSRNSSAKIVHCVFTGNQAGTLGGAAVVWGGAPTFINCKFYENEADMAAGAVFNRNDASPTFVNCLFYGNTGLEAGAVGNLSGVPTFINCTFAGNEATEGKGGVIWDGGGTAVFRNCILWNNQAFVEDTGEIYDSSVSPSTTTVTYSTVKGGWPGVGNDDSDPLFADPANNDYRLGGTSGSPSPCKDGGNDGDVPADLGDLDWDGDVTEQVPFDLSTQVDRVLFSHVDKGAYEFTCPHSFAADPDPDLPDQGYGTKNRYLSFVPKNAGSQTALRVTLTDSDTFPGAVGLQWWVGQPQEVSENAGKIDPAEAPGFPTYWTATFQCEAYYADWAATLGSGVVLHVRGPEVVPGTTYEIQAVHEDCQLGYETDFSAPLVVATSALWGDVTGDCSVSPCTPPDGTVDVVDVTAVYDKFRNLAGAPIKARTDVDPSLPNRLVEIVDITRTNDAANGAPYPFAGPSGCP